MDYLNVYDQNNFFFKYSTLSLKQVLESNMSAAVRVTSRTDNVAGVKLPVFGQYETGAAESNENLGLFVLLLDIHHLFIYLCNIPLKGLVAGGRKILACKEKFSDYLKALIKIASLQTSFLAMDEALKVTNRY